MAGRFILAAALLLSGCAAHRVIERVRTVEVRTPVAAPCPLPADVQPRPVKPSDTLPDDARQALAVAMGHLLELDAWARVAEAQITACSQVK